MSITGADESLKTVKRLPSSVLGIFLVTHAIDNRSQSPALAGLLVGATESHRSYSQQGAGKLLSQFNSNFLRAIDPSLSGILDLQTLNPSREKKWFRRSESYLAGTIDQRRTSGSASSTMPVRRAPVSGGWKRSSTPTHPDSGPRDASSGPGRRLDSLIGWSYRS